VFYAAAQCDASNNDPVLNSDCNYAGTCTETSVGPLTLRKCKCCAPAELDSDNICGDSWVCDPNNPGWGCVAFTGDNCQDYNQYYFINIGIRLVAVDSSLPIDFICLTDPALRYNYGIYNQPSAYYSEQLEYVTSTRGWPGSVKQNPVCDTCTVDYPCTLYIAEGVVADSGIGTIFQVDLNEYYNKSCTTPGWIMNPWDQLECEDNYDYGQIAYVRWQEIWEGDAGAMDEITTVLQSPNTTEFGLGWTNTQVIGIHDAAVFETETDVQVNPTRLPTDIPTEWPTGSPTQWPTESPTGLPTERPTEWPTESPTEWPTESPTELPSASPTGYPTLAPTNPCADYIDDVDNLVFIGIGDNCRAGLNSTWPGGRSCDSPYIICLPQENTPAEFAGEAYSSSTHRYSVSECKQECANDLRCLGIEFVADSESPLGDCNLIDDIPLELAPIAGGFPYDIAVGFNYDPAVSYSNLDSNVTSGNAMCFAKADYCHTQFEADDLNDVMLNCYCPNNRKGFYTKRVKRTVENTRFCGNDNDVNLRIQKAQANRMFHLCENWCLFETEDPEAESWYWDPWKTCWREQYGEDGHNGYCSRVIKNPDTIEMQFINHTRNLFC